MGAHAAVQPLGKLAGELDAVALDRDVDVGDGLLEQQVAHRAADEVGAPVGRRHGLHLGEDVVEAEARQMAGQRGALLRRLRLAASGRSARKTSLRVTTPITSATDTGPRTSPRTTGTRPTGSRARTFVTSSSAVVAGTVVVVVIITALTGAWPSLCRTARSRSRRETAPTRRSPSATDRPP